MKGSLTLDRLKRRPSDNALTHPAGRCPTPRKEMT